MAAAHVAGGLVRGRQIVVKLRLAALNRDGLANEVDGGFRLARLVGDHAEQIQRVGLARILAQHLAIPLFRLRRSPAL